MLSPAILADQVSTPSWLALRDALANHRFRSTATAGQRQAVYDALDLVILDARATGEYVEAVIIKLKHLCADPQLPAAHRFDRTSLASHLVQRCIEQYYNDHDHCLTSVPCRIPS